MSSASCRILIQLIGSYPGSESCKSLSDTKRELGESWFLMGSGTLKIQKFLSHVLMTWHSQMPCSLPEVFSLGLMFAF